MSWRATQAVGEATRRLVGGVGRLLDVVLMLSALVYVTSAGIITYSIAVRKLGHPVGWPDPFTADLLLWGVLLAAGATYLRDEHVNMDTFIDRFPPRLRVCCRLLGDVVTIVFSVVLARAALHITRLSASQHETNIDLPWLAEWVLDLAVLVGAILLIVGGVAAALGRLSGAAVRGEKPTVE